MRVSSERPPAKTAGDKIGTQMSYGRGADSDATGATVVFDLIEIARDVAAGQISAKTMFGIPGFVRPGDLSDPVPSAGI